MRADVPRPQPSRKAARYEKLGISSPGSAEGQVRTYQFNDTNRDGVRQAAEPLLTGVFSESGGFIDHNANGVYDGPNVDERLGIYAHGSLNVMTFNRYAVYPSAPTNYVVTSPSAQVIQIAQHNQIVQLVVGVVVAPTGVVSVSRNIDLALDVVEVQFDRPLWTAAGGPTAIQFRNAAGQQVSVGYQALSTPNTYRFYLLGTVPEGTYTMRIPGPVLAGTATPPQDYVYTFSVLRNDLDLDGTVNFDDLLTVAQNYGQSGKTYSQGNLTRDSSGRVDFDDLLLLAQSYGNSVAQALRGDDPRKGKRDSAAGRLSL